MAHQNSLRAAAAALTVAFATAPAQAQQQQYITAFTTASVIEALAILGITDGQAKKGAGPNGAPFDYVVFSYGGVRHVAGLEVCDKAPGCLGLNLLTVWNQAGAVVDRNRVNDFNAMLPFGKGIVASDALIFQRYTISDGGVSKTNVVSNIANFVASSDAFAKYIGGSGSTGTISAKPGEGALTRASLSSDTKAVIQSLGVENLNRWNAPRGDVPIEAGAHAQPR